MKYIRGRCGLGGVGQDFDIYFIYIGKRSFPKL